MLIQDQQNDPGPCLTWQNHGDRPGLHVKLYLTQKIIICLCLVRIRR